MVGASSLVIAGCGSSSHSGLITGSEIMSGGPSPGHYSVSGTIQAHVGGVDGRIIASVKPRSDGSFEISVPDGSYVLEDPRNNGLGKCVSDPVNVRDGKPVSGIVVTCPGV